MFLLLFLEFTLIFFLFFFFILLCWFAVECIAALLLIMVTILSLLQSLALSWLLALLLFNQEGVSGDLIFIPTYEHANLLIFLQT